MNIFSFRDRIVDEYASYVRSFLRVRDKSIAAFVNEKLSSGELWPPPLIQLNPSFEPGGSIGDLVSAGALHPDCEQIFRAGKSASQMGVPLLLHWHQAAAVRIARTKQPYVLTTGTGSGKSLSYIIPIVDHVLRRGSGRGTQAIIVYPMNALANSQLGELKKFLTRPDGTSPVTFERYTGQETEEDRQRILAHPPDILLTNYVMLELILTRPKEAPLIRAAHGLQFLVFDELHTYRGRQGADVALLVRRIRERLKAPQLQCVGTSATLATEGTLAQQRAEIARVASQMFGTNVGAEHVIGERLNRITAEAQIEEASFQRQLRSRLQIGQSPPSTLNEFISDPLSIWIESTFGVERREPEKILVRAKPKRIAGAKGAASALSASTGLDHASCERAIEAGLQAAYQFRNPQTGRSPFAFRLHQFISRGDTVYASLHEPLERQLTLNNQQFVPGSNQSQILLPLVFCRECGQEYYCVWRTQDEYRRQTIYTPRELRDRHGEDDEKLAGFLYLNSEDPWPELDSAEELSRLPDDWLEETSRGERVKPWQRANRPMPVRVGPDGRETTSGIQAQFVPAPFRFCLSCLVSYAGRQGDFGKLSGLGSEGRSTATTILSLSAIRELRQQTTIESAAQKLLSFTDNRQDASLQAGHFNDFIEVGVLRGALFAAVQAAGHEGLRHEELTLRVFDTLNLPLESYAANPDVKFGHLADTQRALRNVLGYRLFRDQKRGWRISSPNLEQCGLLRIDYQSLSDVCRDEPSWAGKHAALATASVEVRERVSRVLLDYMRRELGIKVNYLNAADHDAIAQQSTQRLRAPWGLDENEIGSMTRAGILFPRGGTRNEDYGGNIYLSSRGGFGLFVGRATTFPSYGQTIGLAERETIIRDLLDVLVSAGLIEEVVPASNKDDVSGFQLVAQSMIWKAGAGTQTFHDPIRIPRQSAGGGRPNEFFVDFYRQVAKTLRGLEAREHTAQVPAADREDREGRFRLGSGPGGLPVLFCSPTMELGIDIADLNVVNMRNIPPTPANYAQRSGRAGRSGQPALVFSYCTSGSPHDQYFFRNPERMVAGAVAPPRLDLTNEDLVRAHVQAIWLAETGLDLKTSLKDLVDISGNSPTLHLLPEVTESIRGMTARQRSKLAAQRVLSTIEDDLKSAGWYSEQWLDGVLNSVEKTFEAACERWRGLHRAAMDQANAQDRIIRDASRDPRDKKQAENLRREAEAQLKLLTETDNFAQSDFYSYRYFASEGFLPGYNFPRLPLSAFIQARRTRQREEFLSRPRFLAISEFGPQTFIYHEGSRYVINRVIMSVREDGLMTTQAKQCEACGYLHPIPKPPGPDNCERCGSQLGSSLNKLLRLQNVATKRRDKINCDEEERMRRGFDIRSGVRFGDQEGLRVSQSASVADDAGNPLLTLTYGRAATLWRINLGWKNRRRDERDGFRIDIESGYWAKAEDDENNDDPMSPRQDTVIPYVEDRRNALLLEPASQLDLPCMASLQAALKNAIQVEFQLEDNELSVELLPNTDSPKLFLFYESAEGGAGVLRRLVEEPLALSQVAERALELCHFDPKTGDDLRHAEGRSEDCEAACYDCLMHYGNQPDHRRLDRHLIRNVLLNLAASTTTSSPATVNRNEHLEMLKRLAGSELERRWLDWLDARRLRLPDHAQQRVDSCNARPDFYYDEYVAAVYIDGPFHDFPERARRDQEQNNAMFDAGINVIRFHHEADWDAIVSQYPFIFGRQA